MGQDMYRSYIKRILDIVVAVLALPALGILAIVVALMTKLSDGGPVFFCAERLGKGGRVFRMLKFRTMIVDAPDIRNEDGSTYNSRQDHRLTRYGKLLRETSLDEVPQILNVLAGHMSMVGPRPSLADAISTYKVDEMGKLNVRPGITGYTQAFFRNSLSVREKRLLDVQYADACSLPLDFRIILQTISTVICRRGIYADTHEPPAGLERSDSLHVLMMRSAGSNAISPSDHLMMNLVQDLVNSNIKVTYILSETTNGKSSVAAHFEDNPNVHIIQISRWALGHKNKFIRFADELLFTLKSIRIALRVPEVNVYYVPSSPTYGIAVILLSRATRKPVVFNLQDVFPDTAVRSGLMSRRLAVLFSIIEHWAYKAASIITVIGQDMQSSLVEKGVSSERIVIAPNWVDTDAVKPVQANENCVLRKYGLSSDCFYVTYAGNMGLAQNLDVVIDAARILADYQQIQFLFIGDGKSRLALEQRVSELRLTNVKFFPFEPQEMVSEVYSTGNTCVVSLRRGVIGNSVPSKACAIMACARPVIACVDEGSSFCRLISDESVGLTVAPDDSRELARAILDLYRSPELASRFGENARHYVTSNLSRRIGTAAYINLFRKLASQA